MRSNKILKGVFFLWSCATLAASCGSSKELSYMTDLGNRDTVSGVPIKPAQLRLKPSDNLYINVFSSNAEMNKMYNPPQSGAVTNDQYRDPDSRYLNGFTIDNEGNVNLPALGKITIAGKTIEEAEQTVKAQAEQLLKDVAVKIRLLNFKVTVLGEVKIPGVFYVNDRSYSVMDALSSARGVSDFASVKNVLVVRKTPSGSQSFVLDLNKKSVLWSEAYYLQPEDVVFVQPSKNKNITQRLPVISIIVGSLSSALLIASYLID
jgi:polysaccharide export outer membrane protein